MSYFYECSVCGTQLNLRTRMTMRLRRCPQCGHLITPEEIDRQKREQRTRQRWINVLWMTPLFLLLSCCCGGVIIRGIVEKSLETTSEKTAKQTKATDKK